MVSSILLLLLTTAFASYASAGRVLVGFRTVCEAEAEAIKELGSVSWDPEHPSAKSDGQLGLGKSHSNTPGLWSGAIAANQGGDWFCYTTAEDSMIKRAVKVWINPLEEEGKSLYPYDEARIQEVLAGAGAAKPATTLRLGRIMDGEELLIPAASLPQPDDKTGGKLLLKTFCFPSMREMKAHMKKNGVPEVADYDDVNTFANQAKYRAVDQTSKQSSDDDEDEGEAAAAAAAAAAPARMLRFMPRDPETLNKMRGAARAPAATGAPSPGTYVLAPGYTITMFKNPASKSFPALKVDVCPARQAAGRRPSTGGARTPQSPSTAKNALTGGATKLANTQLQPQQQQKGLLKSTAGANTAQAANLANPALGTKTQQQQQQQQQKDLAKSSAGARAAPAAKAPVNAAPANGLRPAVRS
ncbi:hypothetical protein PpBr36_08602 [Pyricularia pennisetigena]|uniref:hypothetical protein n=1 Tax=Pyricularia pennisetigena TaxID=1578925 RepID=UPI0011546A11|nr:hypothetical protein PpBr36_08602 [Pyricularia pennisetigena]TLS24870.1 hypothetical protein PpBr36_08602 [Pyricularia pennisetigena]